MLRRQHQTRLAPHSRRPILVFWGAQDRLLGLETTHRFSAGIPGAEVHLLSDSGHASHLEYPYTLARRRTPFESELP